MDDERQDAALARSPMWNLPNQITATRIVVSLAVFVCLHFQSYWWSLILFLLAAGTDWLDGYLAQPRPGDSTRAHPGPAGG